MKEYLAKKRDQREEECRFSRNSYLLGKSPVQIGLKLDWSRAGLCMNLLAFVYSQTKIGDQVHLVSKLPEVIFPTVIGLGETDILRQLY